MPGLVYEDRVGTDTQDFGVQFLEFPIFICQVS